MLRRSGEWGQDWQNVTAPHTGLAACNNTKDGIDSTAYNNAVDRNVSHRTRNGIPMTDYRTIDF